MARPGPLCVAFLGSSELRWKFARVHHSINRGTRVGNSLYSASDAYGDGIMDTARLPVKDWRNCKSNCLPVIVSKGKTT